MASVWSKRASICVVIGLFDGVVVSVLLSMFMLKLKLKIFLCQFFNIVASVIILP